MSSFLFLAAWITIGVALGAVLTPEPGRRFAWAPYALFLGPLWAAVALDRPLPSDGTAPRR